MDELLTEFVVEARELAQQAAEDLMALERDPRDRQRLESAFRAIHTMKGSAGLFPLGPLQATLHAAEDVLGAARGGNDEINVESVDPILAIIDWTDRCIDQIAATGGLGPDAATQAERLVQALQQAPAGTMAAASSPVGGVPGWAAALFDAHPADAALLVALRYVPDKECFFNGDDPLALVGRVPSIIAMTVREQEAWPGLEALDPFRCNLCIELVSGAALAEIEALFRLIPDQVTIVARPAADKPDGVRPAVAATPAVTTTIRVETARVDRLLDIVGELYTAKNGLAGVADWLRSAEGEPAMVRRVAATQLEFDRLLVRLRQAVMGVRMIPLAQTFRRLPRVVREISVQTGKKVDIAVKGGEIEADRLIVDGLFEPLLHVIRNAIDHGIELPEQRSEAGKPALGAITVAADMLGDQIAITISDDGPASTLRGYGP